MLECEVEMQLRFAAIALCLLTGLACANLGSIRRRTALPAAEGRNPGKAIHLDIRQRLAISKVDEYGVQIFCAEPSPDALSAFASSAGGGASVRGQGSASAAQSFSEAASSVGLRTQSITLMRDSAFRICEAYYNGKLTPSDVKVLLTRSQDLTAAVVSIEQLTGAVVAKQAVLGGSGGAASAATLLSNAEALKQAQELEKRAQDELDASKAALGEAKKRRDAALDPNQAGITPEQQAERESTRCALDEEVVRAEKIVALKQEQLASVTKARVAIQSQLDSSITQASAQTTGSGSLVGGSSAGEIEKETVAQIAKAVQSIAVDMLNKSYVVEECMALLTRRNAWLEAAPKLVETCLAAIGQSADAAAARERAIAERNQAELKQLRLTTVVSAQLQERREKAADVIKSLDASQMNALAVSLGLPKGSSRADLLQRVSQANSEALVAEIANAIRKVTGEDI